MNRRGSIVFSLLLVLVLTGLGAGVLLRSVNENKIANRTSNSTQAFWLAEAGVQKTIWEINYNNCAGFVQQGTSTACASCTICGSGNKTMAVSISGAGDYDVVMDNGNTIATSTGSCPSRASASVIQRAVQANIGKKSPFGYAAFSQGQVTLANNTFVDSYNSNNGPYDTSTNSDTNGDIGSNGTTAGIISIGNNISVGGDVSTGVGGTVTVGSNSEISGTTTQGAGVSLPAVTVPAALTGLASSGVKSVSGSSDMDAGDYKYSSMSMDNNATLNVTGAVRLYLTDASAFTAANNVTINIDSGASLQIFVDGVLTINNNVTLSSATNAPKDLQIYSTYTGSNGVTINNNGVLSTAIYAPATDVSVGNNGDIYGSIIGETVSLNNNSALHYDESLSTLSTPVGTTGVTVWQEI
ncbi:MAG: hypothetical protein HY591_00890 [Candidatus Omnitrophica bacterium]|nr:hypothetical protein [Candidatus Omnitrophota bacterium]